ncbi:hypothetical protein [Methylobacterium pseudosasicola]|uniref:hypothetical protein n=1 Tax=Methylobacterium pseudosasicola TaxID=582667 RepID=UPI0011143684|nr:hypothetical protein [Methylobacterium pseudosasicola]
MRSNRIIAEGPFRKRHRPVHPSGDDDARRYRRPAGLSALPDGRAARLRPNAQASKTPGQIENHHYKIHENLKLDNSIYIHAIKINAT